MRMQVEVDSAKVASAASLLGSATPEETMDRALDEVIALVHRRRGLLELAAMAGSDEFADGDRRRDSWG